MAEAYAKPLHEPDVPSVRGLALGGAVIVGMVILAVIVAFFVVRGLTPERAPSRSVPLPSAEPPLQPMPERDLPAFRAEKLRTLHEYAWVDRAHGTVRIPIERAMTLLVEQQSSRTKTP
jgi:hypothetical protein